MITLNGERTLGFVAGQITGRGSWTLRHHVTSKLVVSSAYLFSPKAVPCLVSFRQNLNLVDKFYVGIIFNKTGNEFHIFSTAEDMH